jgi:hypothetical protein
MMVEDYATSKHTGQADDHKIICDPKASFEDSVELFAWLGSTLCQLRESSKDTDNPCRMVSKSACVPPGADIDDLKFAGTREFFSGRDH